MPRSIELIEAVENGNVDSIDYIEALAMGENIEKIRAQLPSIDCGACGARDCDAFAEDIVRGYSTLEECQLIRQEPSNKRK